VKNGLVEPSLEAHPPERRYVARTPVRVHREIPVRVLNATRPDQLTKGSPPAHCTPLKLVTPHDVEQPPVRDTTPMLQDMIAAAKPNLSDTESREMEELTEYGNIFAMDRDYYRQTHRVYHRTDTGKTRPISPSPRRPPSKTGGCGRDAREHATC
jgi:hypothetical protein